LVGPSVLRACALRALATEAEIVGAVPRADVSQHYAWADVLVLPTLSEGSANVVYEAMAAGLAVVTTANAGSIIRDGHDGLIVPARDATAIALAIHRLGKSRDLCQTLGQEAQITMARNTFDLYATRLAAAIGYAVNLDLALCA
jgi:glycosyltransferase involved in cell wall biosynthesis